MLAQELQQAGEDIQLNPVPTPINLPLLIMSVRELSSLQDRFKELVNVVVTNVGRRYGAGFALSHGLQGHLIERIAPELLEFLAVCLAEDQARASVMEYSEEVKFS